MPDFRYEALNEANEVTSGHVSSENVSAAVVQLEAQGLRVTSVHQVDVGAAAPDAATDSPPNVSSLANDDQQALHRCVSKVLEKRDILVPALDAFAEELPRGRSRRSLRTLVSRLRAGATVEQLCNPEDPAASWLPLLAGGAGSDRLLCDLFVEASGENEIRTQWVRVVAYPLFVFLGSLGVFAFLGVAVVPTFSSIFNDFDMDLPELTKVVLGASDMILRHPVSLALALLVGGASLYPAFRLFSAWGLPGRVGNALTAGNSRQVTAMARFTRRLAEALDAGLPLPTALRLAGRAEGRSNTRQVALELAHDAQHETFDMKKSSWARRLPATVVHALQAGPDDKPSVPLLRQLAELYSARVRERCDWSTGFMGQLAIVAMGITVGAVVLALFVPLVELINGLTG